MGVKDDVAADLIAVRAEQTPEEIAETVSDLAELLAEIQEYDSRDPVDYASRNLCVVTAVLAAWWCNYEAGFGLDPSEPGWLVAYVELPSGQVSWHIPQHSKTWDGHDTPEKCRRVREFLRLAAPDE